MTISKCKPLIPGLTKPGPFRASSLGVRAHTPQQDAAHQPIAFLTLGANAMNIDKFKHQHVDILGSIATLRSLAHAGVSRNASEIAKRIVAMSSTIKLHLAVEDRALYPALQRGGDAELARMGQQYQQEMGAIASAYETFARRWNIPENVLRDEQGFRDDANNVLRMVYERMQRENHDFYPRIEAL